MVSKPQTTDHVLKKYWSVLEACQALRVDATLHLSILHALSCVVPRILLSMRFYEFRTIHNH
jgi:hypothetical protein